MKKLLLILLCLPMIGFGQALLFEEDFANEIPENVTIEDISGFGDWQWSDQAPQGYYSQNSFIINSETPENGFMIMEADLYNTFIANPFGSPVLENIIHATFTIGPIDLSSSNTNSLTLQFYSQSRRYCDDFDSACDINIYMSTDGTIFNNLNYQLTDSTNSFVEELVQIPLTDFDTSFNNIYFKFEWSGSHYHWMIDDISVFENSVSVNEDQPFESKKLKNITDLLGQEIPMRKNTPMFYIYDDGTVEKRIVIE